MVMAVMNVLFYALVISISAILIVGLVWVLLRDSIFLQLLICPPLGGPFCCPIRDIESVKGLFVERCVKLENASRLIFVTKYKLEKLSGEDPDVERARRSLKFKKGQTAIMLGMDSGFHLVGCVAIENHIEEWMLEKVYLAVAGELQELRELHDCEIVPLLKKIGISKRKQRKW